MARGRRLSLRKKFYTAIGRFIASWADLEALLDVLTIFLHVSDPNGVKKKLRHELSVKIDRVRKQVSNWKTLRSSCDDIKIILREIEWLASIRNDYVHNSIRSIDTRTGIIKMDRSLKPMGRKPSISHIVTISLIRQNTQCVEDLKRYLSAIIALSVMEVGTDAHTYLKDKIYYDAQILDAESQMRKIMLQD